MRREEREERGKINQRFTSFLNAMNLSSCPRTTPRQPEAPRSTPWAGVANFRGSGKRRKNSVKIAEKASQ
jgi:hypothetical protein